MLKRYMVICGVSLHSVVDSLWHPECCNKAGSDFWRSDGFPGCYKMAVEQDVWSLDDFSESLRLTSESRSKREALAREKLEVQKQK